MARARVKHRPVLLIKENETVEVETVTKASRILGCSRECVQARINNGNPINGYYVDYQLDRE